MNICQSYTSMSFVFVDHAIHLSLWRLWVLWKALYKTKLLLSQQFVLNFTQSPNRQTKFQTTSALLYFPEYIFWCETFIFGRSITVFWFSSTVCETPSTKMGGQYHSHAQIRWHFLLNVLKCTVLIDDGVEWELWRWLEFHRGNSFKWPWLQWSSTSMNLKLFYLYWVCKSFYPAPLGCVFTFSMTCHRVKHRTGDDFPD